MQTTISISLPEAMKRWVEQNAVERGYATASKFLYQLLREEQQRQAQQQIEGNLRQALNSDASTPMTAANWKRIRREGIKGIARQRKAP